MGRIIGGGILGSGGGAISPDAVSGLVLWLKSDGTLWQDSGRTTPATADTNPVGAWDDASGNANHVIQATAANRPILKTAIINGKPVVRFDGSNDVLQRTTLNRAQPATVFIVCTVSGSGAFARVFDSWDANPGRMMMGKQGDNSTNCIFAGTVLSYAESLPTTIKYWTATFNGATSTLHRNGTSVASGAAGAGGWTGFNLGAGAVAGGGANEFANVDIAEVAVYSSALAAGTRQGIERYLKNKYAL